MSMTPDSARYFSENAGRWDALRAGYFGDAVREAAIRRAYLRPEMVVADVGAGTGLLSAGLAPRAARVHVIDGSEAMLAIARQNLSAFANLTFHTAEGTSLPLPDESVDAVFANMFLHHLPDPLAAIQEMVRILRPGGRVVITDLDAHPYAWLKDEMADVWQGFERSQVLGWFEQAGLVNRYVTCTGADCCAETSNPALTDEQGRSAEISVFVAAAAKRVPHMAAAVTANYAGLAEGASCGCGSSADAGCCGENALSAGSSCCGSEPAPVIDLRGYRPEELAAVPAEAAEFSFGCGNPTALAALQPGQSVLDIGSGGGIDCFLAAQRVGPAGRVIGVDVTPAMIERARASAERNGLGWVEFRHGQAEALPVDDNSVDVVLSNCVINLTDDKGRVFAEIYRVLKPGGRLEVSDVVAGGAFLPATIAANGARWAGCEVGALPEQEYLDLIAQAGFAPAQVRTRVAAGQADGVRLFSLTVSAEKKDFT
ncbi:MAG TPA: arsenite methyltransferase [Anaerolineaceae bacterium]|nr:arsenite methyltransferase [Anaerolineaceae bacterium]